MQSDPPNHTRMRAVFGRALSPQRIAAMESSIRATTNALIDGFIRDGQGDLVQPFAYPLPVFIICHLIGVPREDMQQLKGWSDEQSIPSLQLTRSHVLMGACGTAGVAPHAMTIGGTSQPNAVLAGRDRTCLSRLVK